MATANQCSAEPRFVLYGVPWQVYLALRTLPENEHVRMTYDRGALEMMRPSKRHEQFAVMVELLIHAWAEEGSIDILGCRTMTCRREDLDRGFEPDNCYYVAHEAEMRSKDDLDLRHDPPPDLAIEIDISTSSLEKLELYEAFGVPEVWLYDTSRIRVYVLQPDGIYSQQPRSNSFPFLPLDEVERFLQRRDTTDETTLIREFRDWVRNLGR